MKEYAIVRFVETNDFSEIPNNWIQNRNSEKITCKWPPPTVKNTNSLIKSRCSPGIDWLSYEIEILKYCDTLEKARKLAEDADYTSSDEILGRGCRKRQPSAVASMEINLNESESSDDDLTNIPASQLPTFRADNIATESTTNNFDNMSEVLFVEVDGNNYGENKENVIQRLQNVEGNTAKLLTLVGKVLVEMKDLKQEVASLNSNKYTYTNNKVDEIKKYLPLQSQEAVKQFEKILSSEENHKGFLQIIYQVGGINGEDFSKRVFDLLFSSSFAYENTWEGKKTKFSVKSLTLIEIVQEVILKKFPDWTCAEFEKTGLNWFRLGSQRSGNQPSQKQKRNSETATSNAETKKIRYTIFPTQHNQTL